MRNTILVISFLAIIAALLVGFNLGQRLKDQPAPSPTPTPIANSLETYSSCGISFDYPQTLTKLEATSGATMFVDQKNASNSMALACQRDIPRPPLSPDKIEERMIGTVSAILYHDASPKDGTPIDELIFTHPATGLDVFLAGFGEVFDRVLSSLKVL